jgi:hypothetical protein
MNKAEFGANQSSPVPAEVQDSRVAVLIMAVARTVGR